MKRFKDILVIAPRDVDMRKPLQAAASLAASNNARVTLFDSLGPLRFGRGAVLPGYKPDDVHQLMEQARRAELEALAAEVPHARVHVDVGTGRGFIEIIRRVQERGHDLVIAPPDQPGGLVGFARASTTMHLLRKCPVPVWVIRPEVPSTGDVLAAVGPFEEGTPTPLDRKIVELGSSLAAQRRGDFHLVHAWSLEGESLLRNGRVKMPASEVDQLVSEARLMAEDGTAKLLAEVGLGTDEVTAHVVEGRPVTAIGQIAGSIDAGVVVMGTLSRTGVSGLIMGNTAESTLGNLRASVMAVKPEDFKTPIESTRSLLSLSTDEM
ncbi:MAG: universal stress protein [Acidimicrobiia bacterium]|nr:universal stress protein [Acidimicrobiia bacterium]